jgi:putative membrane protein
MMEGMGSMFFGGGFMWIFWLLLIVVIIVVIKVMRDSTARHDDREQENPLSILEKRYARGEIDREEYHAKRRELES